MLFSQRRLPNQGEARLAVGGWEAAVSEGQAAPAKRLHGIIVIIADGGMGADVEQPRSAVAICGEAGMFAKNISGAIISEGC